MPLIGGGDDPPAGPPGGGGVTVEDAYQLHADLLRDIAQRKFRVPSCDAEALVNEVFTSFLVRGEKVRDPRKWLIGAVCHASRGYWRSVARVGPMPEDVVDLMDPDSAQLEQVILDRVTLADTLNQLGPKCRETLRLFYAEGYSAAEIAERFETTPGYVEQLLHNCRKRAREIYLALLKEKRK